MKYFKIYNILFAVCGELNNTNYSNKKTIQLLKLQLLLIVVNLVKSKLKLSEYISLFNPYIFPRNW